jgi:hypothetical protein
MLMPDSHCRRLKTRYMAIYCLFLNAGHNNYQQACIERNQAFKNQASAILLFSQ